MEFDFDWQTRRFTRSARAPLVQPGDFTADGYQINAAFDPDMVQFKGEYWISFECALTGVRSTSLCAVPWSEGAGADKRRMSVVVKGEIDPKGELYTASVGKLLVHQARLYAFWSSIRMTRESDLSPWRWTTLTTRGMEVEVRSVAGGPGMIYPLRSNVPVRASDPLHTVEVLGVRDVPRSNTVADAFAFYSDGTNVFSTAALGGSDCMISEPKNSINTSAKVPGCYRLGIFASAHPLTHHGFNFNKVPDKKLFGNWQSYTRLVKDPAGNKYLLGHYGRGPVPIAGSPLLPVGSQTALFLYPAPAQWSDLLPIVKAPKFPRRCDLEGLRSWGRQASSADVSRFKVSLLYCLALGRLPDPAGENAFLGALAAGKSMEVLFDGVFQSMEYQRIHLPRERNDASFVQLLYQTYLGRLASRDEILAQLSRMHSAGWSRETMRSSIFHSAEFRRVNEVFFR